MGSMVAKRAASWTNGRGLLLGAAARAFAVARAAVLLAAVALALAPGVARAAAGAEQAIPLPARSSGDLLYYFDVATFPSRPGPARSEIYLRLPGNELVYADSTSAVAGTAKVHVKLRAKNARGKTAIELERDLEVPAAERDTKGFSLGHVVLLPVTLPAGWCELRLEVSDLRSQKRGLAYVGQKAHHTGKIEGTVFVPAWDPAAETLSQIEPAWSIKKGVAEGPFARADVSVLPNPTRTYGLYASTVRAYYEFAPAESGGAVVTTARVLDPKGKVLLTAEPDTARPGGQWGQVAFDVSTLPAGAYDLEVALTGGAARVARTTRFNMAWKPASWQGDTRELLDEAHLLLDDQEKEDEFAQITVGEQEAYLDHYWAERDPTPGSAVNEARDRFYERVAYANRNFGTAGIEKGMDSDRGRTYIRYGEPDEIRREVMPTNGLTADDIAKAVAATDGFDQAVPLKGRGAGGDMRSFEIWTYDLLVNPNTSALKEEGPRRPMRRVFVFIDEEGYGNYVLRYTND